MFGNSRETARARMNVALDSYVISGVSHNIPFLRALMDEPAFIKGDITTSEPGLTERKENITISEAIPSPLRSSLEASHV